MKQSFLILLVFLTMFAAGCGSSEPGNAANSNKAANSNATANSAGEKPANGFFSGKGTVTKINNDLGSVELDHEEIVGHMPAMKMEFSVKDKKMLEPVAVGDAVTFTIQSQDGRDTIIAIGK